MSIFGRFFRAGHERAALQPLYAAIVAAARRPAWYIEGKVPDTLDGRFDTLAALLSLVLLRLEGEGDACAAEAATLAEIFVEDMDGQLREIGIGDVVVGKHIGRMMSALGGRLGAYRDAMAADGDLAVVIERNLYRGVAPEGEALGWTVRRMSALRSALMTMPVPALLDGQWSDT